VTSFLPSVQLPLEMAPQLATAHALQVEEPTRTYVLHVGTVQLPLGMALGTTHIHPTHLVGVRGWAENQVFWNDVHNVRVGVRMAKLAALQLVQLVGVRFAVRGPTN
jgi:hypothetical protein